MSGIPDIRERRKYRARLAATGLVLVTAAVLYAPAPMDVTPLTYGFAMGVLALLLTEWRPGRAR